MEVDSKAIKEEIDPDGRFYADGSYQERPAGWQFNRYPPSEKS